MRERRCNLKPSYRIDAVQYMRQPGTCEGFGYLARRL